MEVEEGRLPGGLGVDVGPFLATLRGSRLLSPYARPQGPHARGDGGASGDGSSGDGGSGDGGDGGSGDGGSGDGGGEGSAVIDLCGESGCEGEDEDEDEGDFAIALRNAAKTRPAHRLFVAREGAPAGGGRALSSPEQLRSLLLRASEGGELIFIFAREHAPSFGVDAQLGAHLPPCDKPDGAWHGTTASRLARLAASGARADADAPPDAAQGKGGRGHGAQPAACSRAEAALRDELSLHRHIAAAEKDGGGYEGHAKKRRVVAGFQGELGTWALRPLNRRFAQRAAIRLEGGEANAKVYNWKIGDTDEPLRAAFRLPAGLGSASNWLTFCGREQGVRECAKLASIFSPKLLLAHADGCTHLHRDPYGTVTYKKQFCGYEVAAVWSSEDARAFGVDDNLNGKAHGDRGERGFDWHRFWSMPSARLATLRAGEVAILAPACFHLVHTLRAKVQLYGELLCATGFARSAQSDLEVRRCPPLAAAAATARARMTPRALRARRAQRPPRPRAGPAARHHGDRQGRGGRDGDDGAPPWPRAVYRGGAPRARVPRRGGRPLGAAQRGAARGAARPPRAPPPARPERRAGAAHRVARQARRAVRDAARARAGGARLRRGAARARHGAE